MSNNSKPKNKHNGGSSHQFNGGGDTSLASDVYEEMMERNMTEKETQTIMLLVKTFESHLSVNFRKFEKQMDAKLASHEQLMSEKFSSAENQMNTKFTSHEQLMTEKFSSAENQMNTKFAGVDKQFEGVQRQFEGVQRQFEGVQREFVQVNNKIDDNEAAAKKHRAEVRGKFADLEKRFNKLWYGIILIGLAVGLDSTLGKIVLDIILKLLGK